jgi:iron complex outermembrane receptor protein
MNGMQLGEPMRYPTINPVSFILLATLANVNAYAQTEEPTPPAEEAGAEAPPAPPVPNAAPVPATAPTGKSEVIQVTGSRIKRKDLDVASPLTIYGREEIANTGAETVTDVVKSLPSAVGNSVTTTTTNGGGAGAGNIALRGLDSSSTLVLINGRRLPVDANGDSPDLNSIPVGAIERIEVLQDGASAIYGSDAIAGVINIITRKNFDGLDLGFYFGRSHQGDMDTKNYDLAYGASGDKGSMILGLNYYSQEKVKSRDRGVSRQAIRLSPATPNGVTTIGEAQTVLDAAGNQSPWDETLYNYGDITDAIMAQDRKSLFISGDYKLSSSVKAFIETSFTNTESQWDSAPTPLYTSQETGAITVTADNPYNAYGTDLNDVARRFVELGPRKQSASSDTLRFVAGLQGDIGKWAWDISANHGEVDTISKNNNIVNKGNLIVGLSGPDACGGLTALGCVPINILSGPGTMGPDQLKWLRLGTTDYAKTFVNSYTFNTSGELASFDWGKVSMAAGVEVREESYDNQTDANSENFNTIGNTNQKSTKGDRDVKEIYLEFGVPIGQYVEVDLAARYSDYSDFGDTTNPKFGLKITPVKGLTVRGTYGTGFRAPGLTELYQGESENFAQITDICQKPGVCPQGDSDPNDFQWLVIQGGNPDLKPEKSKSYTFGLAYTFENVFNAKADYWVIETENAIDTVPDFIVNQFRTNGSFADRVTTDASNNITLIRATALNLASRKIKGLDLGIDYAFRNTPAGTFTTNLLATHYIDYQNQADKTAPFTNVVGKYVDAAAGGRGSIPKWKGIFDVGYALAGVQAGVTMNYVSGLDDEVGGGYPKLDAWRTYDARLGYDFNQGGVITLGIDNVTDKAPPTSKAAGNDNIDARTHNLIGRFYYGRYNVSI